MRPSRSPMPSNGIELLNTLLPNSFISQSLPACGSRHVAVVTRCSGTRPPHCRYGASRSFTSSSTFRGRRRSPFKSITKAELDQHAKVFPKYTAAEKTLLQKQFSPDQIAAIEAGESAVTDSDLATQARVRRDVWRPDYMDTFARIEPIIDKKLSKLRGVGQADHLYKDIPDTVEMPSPAKELSEHEARMSEFFAEGQWSSSLDEGTGETKWEFRGDPQTIIMRMMEEDRDGLDALRTRLESEGKLAVEVPEAEQAEMLARARAGPQAPTETQPSDGKQTLFPENPPAMSAEEALKARPEGDPNGKTDLFNAFYNIKLAEFKQSLVRKSKGKATDAAAAYPGPVTRFRLAPRDHDETPDVAPVLPRIDDPGVLYSPPAEESAESYRNSLGNDEASREAYAHALKVLGMDAKELRSFRVRRLLTRRVVNQTRLGKIPSMYVISVAGNEDGLVGIGEGKSAELPAATDMARINALRNMVPIHRYEGRTIFGRVRAKVGATEVELSAAKPGFGLRVSANLYEIAKCAGIRDLSGKLPRARTPMNVCKAVWEALRSQKDPEQIAMARGKKLVDVRKVYYNGNAG